MSGKIYFWYSHHIIRQHIIPGVVAPTPIKITANAPKAIVIFSFVFLIRASSSCSFSTASIFFIFLIFSNFPIIDTFYDVSVKSINCVCACTNKQFILIDTPNTENGIKWCEYAILWEFEVFEDCGNCIAMEQSGYIKWVAKFTFDTHIILWYPMQKGKKPFTKYRLTLTSFYARQRWQKQDPPASWF